MELFHPDIELSVDEWQPIQLAINNMGRASVDPPEPPQGASPRAIAVPPWLLCMVWQLEQLPVTLAWQRPDMAVIKIMHAMVKVIFFISCHTTASTGRFSILTFTMSETLKR
jgi:hypothetical protein